MADIAIDPFGDHESRPDEPMGENIPLTPVGGSTWETECKQETSFGGESQRTKLMKDYVNSLRAAVDKSGQCGTSLSHGLQENSTEKHQPVSEGISWEPRIVSSHTTPQKIAKKISFQVTENDMMVA